MSTALKIDFSMSQTKEKLISALTDYHVVGAYIHFNKDIVDFFVVPAMDKDLRPALRLQLKKLAEEYTKKHGGKLALRITHTNSNSQLKHLMPRGYETIFETKKQIVVS